MAPSTPWKPLSPTLMKMRVVEITVVGIVLAAIAFLIILAAIGWSVYEIYTLGHPAPAKK